MAAQPLVSIIVRSYRGRGAMLRKALESLARQDYPALEVLVIEDGSAEHQGLVESLNGKEGISFRHFPQPKLGRSMAANVGLERAQGKYIGFLDDDDYFYPNHCSLLAGLLETSPEAAAVHAASVEVAARLNRQTMAFENEREVCINYITSASSAELLFRNLFPIQAVLFRRDILGPQNRFDPNLDALEDWLFWLRLLLGRKIIGTPDITSAYHVPLEPGEIKKRQHEHTDAETYFETQRWALYEERGIKDTGAVLDYCKRTMRAAQAAVKAPVTEPKRSAPHAGNTLRMVNGLGGDPVPVLKPGKSGIAAFTSVNLAYLPKALVWAESMKAHHPDWDVHVLLSDAYPEKGINWPNVDVVFPIHGLGIENFQPWLFGMRVVEVCTAVKSFYSCKLLEAGYQHVFYFDPDMRIYGKLDYLMQQFETNDVLLTPHCTKNAISDAEMHFNEMSVLAHGIYNLGFVGFKNTEIGRGAAEFWRRRMKRHCRDDHARGLFTDQKWWNLAPIFFDKVGIIKHDGCNAASWNIAQRPMTFKDGRYYAGDKELLFFHFSGYDGNVPRRMFDIFGQFNDALAELIADYDKRLADFENRFKGYKEEWAFRRFDNNEIITDAMRVHYRDRYENELIYKEPFFAWARESFFNHVKEIGEAHLRAEAPPGFLRRYY